MKKYLLASLAVLALMQAQTVTASSTQYEMRVDGLACPFCAYGIEKKFKAIEGTANINVDLDKGLVSVDLVEGRRFTDAQMKQLFEDSGFTFRSMKTLPHE
jgi:mercuric ion binding protein